MGLMLAGGKVDEQLASEVAQARIVLLLVSSDSMASDLCQDLLAQVEAQRAVRKVTVVPILVRPVVWRGFGKDDRQALPRNGQAVTLWSNQDAAWVDVVQDLRALLTGSVVSEPSARPSGAAEHAALPDKRPDQPAPHRRFFALLCTLLLVRDGDGVPGTGTVFQFVGFDRGAERKRRIGTPSPFRHSGPCSQSSLVGDGVPVSPFRALRGAARRPR